MTSSANVAGSEDMDEASQDRRPGATSPHRQLPAFTRGGRSPPRPIAPRVDIDMHGSAEGGVMGAPQRVGATASLPPGKVTGAGHYAVGNAGGRYFAVTRRCRHLGADLAGGSVDENGCLICP